MNLSTPLPHCWLYNPDCQSWQSFNHLTVILPNHQQVFLYENSNSLSTAMITKIITYDYIAYFSRVVPSSLLTLEKSPHMAEHSSIKGNNDLNFDQITCILVLEDLTLRYSPMVHDDQFILIGFQVTSTAYEESNYELMKVKDLISQIHYKLNYSRGGIIHQVSQRIQSIIYKTAKYALCGLAELFNIHQSIRSQEKLEIFQKMCNDPKFCEYLISIIQSPVFSNDLASLAYKTILQVGLLPCYVELNTMDEVGIWVKIKDLLTNQENAPFGANHHASFCIGNYRYSFVFEFRDKEKQGLIINLEAKRAFSFKNRSFQYFRIPVLDFFPMDSWVREICSAVSDIINIYLDQTCNVQANFSEKTEFFKEVLEQLVYGGPYGEEGLSYEIAEKFYEKYQAELEGNQMLEKLSNELFDAEFKGYRHFSNNCQTLISKILDVLHLSLSGYKQGLNPVIEREEPVKRAFLKFGAHFNYKFRHIGPFSITQQLPLLNVFVEKDTMELFGRIRFENVYEYTEEYLRRENVKNFLRVLEKGLDAYTKKYKDGCVKNIILREGSEIYNEIDMDFKKDYGAIVCLMIIKYNELFQVKREIKIAKYCKAKLEESWQVDHRTVAFSFQLPKRRRLRGIKRVWEGLAARLPDLYSKKYKLMNVCRELKYYYYNTVRLGASEKPNGTTIYCGFVVVKDLTEGLEIGQID